MAQEREKFLRQQSCPAKFSEVEAALGKFVEEQRQFQRKIVLVTSGGTAVPLESRTVRFIDNFSIGTRGASSTEYFLQEGYAVIFLNRDRSLKPFQRHFSHQNMLDLLHLDLETNSTSVKKEYESKVSRIVQRYTKCKEQNQLLSIEFQTLGEYLTYLQACATALRPLGSNAMLYLAAAVSDFYIPKEQMPEHKIQSSDGPIQLSLQLVPKMLEPLVSEWVPEAFTVSFKLETDKDLLVPKAKQALEKYKHQMVIANVLETRKREVTLITSQFSFPINLTAEEISRGVEIEERIVQQLKLKHCEFCEKNIPQ
ncbi:hypothetical protein FSP39_023758 [Pinctada imbricata]|uniref:Phosphopantothenate--cysteine ligase n=1 Tax=Pinctada imbricata TaxID=66713 RepID=A0AA89BXZ3_PINIB|nr:hypothetical protein FSP39_023758 [Pinctada imbricata]